MEYHQDRFEDASCLVINGKKLVAVFPANINEGAVYSHQGLSYGGLVIQADLKFKSLYKKTLSIFEFF